MPLYRQDPSAPLKEKELLEKVGTEAKVLQDLIQNEKDSRLASAEKQKEEMDKNSQARNKELDHLKTEIDKCKDTSDKLNKILQ